MTRHVETIRTALADDDPGVRAGACWALGATGRISEQAHLLPLVADGAEVSLGQTVGDYATEGGLLLRSRAMAMRHERMAPNGVISDRYHALLATELSSSDRFTRYFAAPWVAVDLRDQVEEKLLEGLLSDSAPVGRDLTVGEGVRIALQRRDGKRR